jgi:sialic acid synthase
MIDGRRIADDEPCYVIAEIGNNHGGDVEVACQMIDAAAQSGVDAVKFQRRTNATLYSRALLDKPYDNLHSYGPTYGTHRERLELPLQHYFVISHEAAAQDVTWFATAFDERSADELMEVGIPAFKLPSGALTDLALLSHVAKLGKPIILSTGGGTMADIDEAVATLLAHTRKFALLHCTASYPCAFEELNLRVIQTMRDRYPEVVIGWSGHDNGIAMSVAAYTLGARIIEKHFTLNRTMKGTDHAFSLEPAGMKKLCRDLQRAQVALGDGEKRFYDSEKAPISKMRRVRTAHGWQITGELCSTSQAKPRSSRVGGRVGSVRSGWTH